MPGKHLVLDGDSQHLCWCLELGTPLLAGKKKGKEEGRKEKRERGRGVHLIREEQIVSDDAGTAVPSVQGRLE